MSIVYPFPVLHESTLDYKDPSAYTSELRREGKIKVVIGHRLKRDTLVGSLVLSEKAAFYCTVSVRGTTFRSTQIVDHTTVESIHDMLEAQQVVKIPEYPWSPEVFASSGVVLLEDHEVSTQAQTDLMDFFNEESTVQFPAQAKIAFKEWVRFFSMGALFQIQSEDSIEDGAFAVEITRINRLQIFIKLPHALCDEVTANREGAARRHILCASLTQAFQELLQAQQIINEGGVLDREEAEQFLELAEGLKQYLEGKEIPTWEDDNFNPAYSASLCYKVGIPDAGEDEEMEE